MSAVALSGGTALRRYAGFVVATAVGLFALAAAMQPAVVHALRFEHLLLTAETEASTRWARNVLLATASVVMVLGALLRLVGARLDTARTPSVRVSRTLGIVTAVHVFVAVVFALEVGLTPFVERPTALFVADPDLEWRNRPGVDASYLGSPVRTNSHGLRGPERPRAKEAGTLRILFLGDSVVFGVRLDSDEDTLPALVEERLAAEVPTRVECINAGVAGWSTWQERAWFLREGVGYEPDLVVLGFVLNDVTERHLLRRFGGATTGALEHARGHLGLGPFERSSVFLFARAIGARLRFGRDVSSGADRAQRVDMYHLLLAPRAAEVAQVWAQVLREIEEIQAACEARGARMLLVAFPCSVQIEQPELDAPQELLARFAESRSLPYLDLLPVMLEPFARGELDLDGLFFDALHPTAQANRILAERVAEKITSSALLSPR